MKDSELKDFAAQLGLPQEGQFIGGEYTVDLKNSDEYSKMYTLLDNSDLLQLNADVTLLNEDVSQLLYEGENEDVKLVANFKEDT